MTHDNFYRKSDDSRQALDGFPPSIEKKYKTQNTSNQYNLADSIKSDELINIKAFDVADLIEPEA